MKELGCRAMPADFCWLFIRHNRTFQHLSCGAAFELKVHFHCSQFHNHCVQF